MKVEYKTKDGRMVIEFTIEGIENVVTCLASIMDILENTRCECCVNAGRDDEYGTILVRRVSAEYLFFEAKCRHPECGAALALSQRKKESGGGLYTKREQGKKDPSPGTPLPNNGWVIYQRDEQRQMPQQQAPAPVQPMSTPYQQQGSAPSPAPVSPHPPVDDSDIPFAFAFAFVSAGLLGGMICASQDLFQVWC